MNTQFASELAELRAQIAAIEAKGINYDQMMNVIDGIIKGDLANWNYQATSKPLSEAADKQKEASRIINNYGIALASLAADKKSGKDDTEKSMLKLSIIVGAATAGLNALGFTRKYIDTVLGITGAAKK